MHLHTHNIKLRWFLYKSVDRSFCAQLCSTYVAGGFKNHDSI